MKRGFKTKAKSLALELRAEIELGPFDPFDPWALAELYGVRVYSLSEIDCSQQALTHFTTLGAGAFSGALIPDADGLLAVENSSHALVRRRSTLSHEMAHVTLEHQFALTMVDARGCRLADGEQEEEAAELSGELLIPFVAARACAIRGESDQAVASHFKVSLDAARWRMNATGARKIAARAAAYRSGRTARRRDQTS